MERALFHEEIWPLVRDLTRYQIKGEMPRGEVAKQLGNKAKPLLQDIEAAVIAEEEDGRDYGLAARWLLAYRHVRSKAARGQRISRSVLDDSDGRARSAVH